MLTGDVGKMERDLYVLTVSITFLVAITKCLVYTN